MSRTKHSLIGMGLILLMPVMPGMLLAQTTATTGKIDPQAAKLIRDVANHLKAVDTIKLTLKSDMQMQMGEMKQDVKTTYTATFQRPNKIALFNKEGPNATTTVSNGSTVTLFTASENNYIQLPVGDSLEDFFNGIGLSMTMPGLDSFVADDPYKNIMDGVTSATYIGVSTLNGTKAHHAIFEQEKFQWQAWISQGTTSPVILRIELGLKPSHSGNEPDGDSSAMDNNRFASIMDYSNWEFNKKIPSSVFEFNPPVDAIDVSDAFKEASGSEEDSESHMLLGHPAPALHLNLLEGGSVKSDDLTSTVVILDFWASWCAPCRQALPLIDSVAATFADQPVRFYAVNIDESTATIKEFVDKTKLKMPVAMDAMGDVSKAYKISSIPATFLIGADGTVQAVHEGLSPNAEEELTSQVKALLRGETLSEKSTKPLATSARETYAEDSKSTAPELTTAWSFPGTWSSTGYDAASGVIIVLGRKGTGSKVTFTGKKMGDFKAEDAGSVLRLAQLNDSPELELLTFDNWGNEVRAFTNTGEQLWKKAGGAGIDDVWAGDLTADGMDEVIVGYNGGTGLHALTPSGKPMWEYSRIGNVWHVYVADVTGDNTPEVITTSAAGKLHIFDAVGKKIKDIKTSLYATMVRVAHPGEKSAIILTGGSGLSGEMLAAYNVDGKEQWSKLLQKGKSGNIDSAAVSEDGKLVAVGLRGGTIFVLETATGEVLGKVTKQDRNPQVSWATDLKSSQTILLSPTENQLNALVVTHRD